MIIHSEKGKRLFENIADNYIYSYASMDGIDRGVNEFELSPKVNPNREVFFEDYKKFSMEDLINKYYPRTFLVKLNRTMRMILSLLRLDGIVKRLLK